MLFRSNQRLEETKINPKKIKNNDDFLRALLQDQDKPFEVIPFIHPSPMICCKQYFLDNLSISEPCQKRLRRCGGMLSPKTEEFNNCIGVSRYGLSAPLYEETSSRSFPHDITISKSNYKSILEKPTCCLCRIIETATFYHFLNMTSREYPSIIFLTLFNRIYPDVKKEMVIKLPILVNSSQEHIFLIKHNLFFDALSIKEGQFDVSGIFV